jgi:RimJ/RimL family protein N-acetyltransferase
MDEPLFTAGAVRARVLRADEVPALQRLFEANPEYFLAIHGIPPRADEAQQEFDDVPPAWMNYGARWVIGLVDEAGALVGTAGVLSDFLVPGVWHVGLFMLASERHGSGLAAALYSAMEAWMQRGGARWVRLGVVQGNAKAEAFWAKMGFIETRKRFDADTGVRRHTLRVCVKPLAGQTVEGYLALMERDRPGSELP